MSAQVVGCLFIFALGLFFTLGGLGLAGGVWISSMWGGFWRLWETFVTIVCALVFGAIGVAFILWGYSLWPYVWVLK